MSNYSYSLIIYWVMKICLMPSIRNAGWPVMCVESSTRVKIPCWNSTEGIRLRIWTKTCKILNWTWFILSKKLMLCCNFWSYRAMKNLKKIWNDIDERVKILNIRETELPRRKKKSKAQFRFKCRKSCFPDFKGYVQKNLLRSLR